MIVRNVFLLCLVVVCFAQVSSATPQLPNSLFFDGKEYPIDNDPMEEYFEKHPERKPNPTSRMSALWRGYLAFFEFRGEDLFLKDLKIEDGHETVGNLGYFRWKSVLKESVGDEKGLKVDWFSGLLVSRYGENDYMDTYDIFEHQKHYSNYTIFEIASGVLKQYRFFDNKGFLQFLKEQFAAFKKTAEFKGLLRKLGENGRKRQASEAILAESILDCSKTILVK